MASKQEKKRQDKTTRTNQTYGALIACCWSPWWRFPAASASNPLSCKEKGLEEAQIAVAAHCVSLLQRRRAEPRCSTRTLFLQRWKKSKRRLPLPRVLDTACAARTALSFYPTATGPGSWRASCSSPPGSLFFFFFFRASCKVDPPSSTTQGPVSPAGFQHWTREHFPGEAKRFSVAARAAGSPISVCMSETPPPLEGGGVSW